MGSGALNYERKRIVANWGIDPTVPPFPYVFDDFVGDTLDTSLWAATAPQETAGTRFAISTTAGDPVAGHGGWISATTGTGDDDNEVINGELIWRADRARHGRMLVFETRVSLPSVANINVQAGLTDAKNEAPLALGASQAITATADDAVAWIYDTDATTDQWYGACVDSTVVGTATPTAGVTEAATTATVLRIEVDSTGRCFYYFNGSQSDSTLPTLRGSDAVGVTETVLLCPFVNVRCRDDANNKVVEVDYIFTACAR